MAVTSSSSNPIVQFFDDARSGRLSGNNKPDENGENNPTKPPKEEVQKVVDQAGPPLATLLDDLYPNVDNVTLKDSDLKSIVENGYITGPNGSNVNVSDGVREAAKKILDIGGVSVINPNGDPWMSDKDLRNAVAYGVWNKAPK